MRFERVDSEPCDARTSLGLSQTKSSLTRSYHRTAQTTVPCGREPARPIHWQRQTPLASECWGKTRVRSQKTPWLTRRRSRPATQDLHSPNTSAWNRQAEISDRDLGSVRQLAAIWRAGVVVDTYGFAIPRMRLRRRLAAFGKPVSWIMSRAIASRAIALSVSAIVRRPAHDVMTRAAA